MRAWIAHGLTGWIDAATPATPTELAATPSTFGEVFVSWVDNSWNETAFVLERSVDSGNFVAIATVGPNVTSLTDFSAPSLTSTRYRIRAFNKDLPSNYSDIASCFTPVTPNNFFVDFRNMTPPFLGTDADPYPSIDQAFAVPPLDAARKITIQAGTYVTTFPANPPPTRLEARGGTVPVPKALNRDLSKCV